MSETKTFTRFGNLPTELRLMIWSEALSVRSIWAAVFDKDPRSPGSPPMLASFNTDDMTPPQLAEFRSRLATRVGPPPSAMAYVGPASYPAGLACGESRWLLEQSHVKFPRGPGLATGPGAYWVDPESTIVYLGRAPHARATLDDLGADELRQIRHVALRPCQYWSIYEACRRLAKECPALRTIIIHCDGLGHVSEPLVSEDLSPELAAYYATIPDSSIGVGDWNENFDDLQLVSSLEPCFGDSPPMFHVVPSPPQVYSGFLRATVTSSFGCFVGCGHETAGGQHLRNESVMSTLAPFKYINGGGYLLESSFGNCIIAKRIPSISLSSTLSIFVMTDAPHMLSLTELENAATDAIRILQGLTEFSHTRIAVAGEVALWRYLPKKGTGAP